MTASSSISSQQVPPDSPSKLTSYWWRSLSGSSAKKWFAFTIHLWPILPLPGRTGNRTDLLDTGGATASRGEGGPVSCTDNPGRTGAGGEGCICRLPNCWLNCTWPGTNPTTAPGPCTDAGGGAATYCCCGAKYTGWGCDDDATVAGRPICGIRKGIVCAYRGSTYWGSTNWGSTYWGSTYWGSTYWGPGWPL